MKFLKDFDAEPTEIEPELLDWFRAAMQAASEHPHMRGLMLNDEIQPGGLRDVEVILCSPSALENIFELSDNSLGCHNVSNPDCDPFKEESWGARGYRVLIGWDPERINEKIFDADPDEPALGALSWLITFTHELHHVRLFAENGAMSSPADLDSMADETGRDLFDISTGYGIRPLYYDGVGGWAGNAAEAAEFMEGYVEARGREMAETLFVNELSPYRFLEAAGFVFEDCGPEGP